ncbi:MAG TPA: hypothetical protein DHW07_05550 [Gammaproteobacteria bacterium]|nr:hypothetical protein [Gammaproteobacteria bacterium]
MCFVAVALGVHPEFPLILAANRDEYFARATEPLACWRTSPAIAAGRDLSAGGTWLGLSQEGRFAALTNCRTKTVSSMPGSKSRGTIVRDFLLGHEVMLEAVATGTLAHHSAYGGFNLIAGTPFRISILSNATKTHTQETSGVFVLSNCPPESQWAKTRVGQGRFSETLSSALSEEDLKDELFLLLSDAQPLEVSSDPSEDDNPLRLVQNLIFVKGVEYGTRASSVILIHRDRHAVFFERTFDNLGGLVAETAVDLNLKLQPETHLTPADR